MFCLEIKWGLFLDMFPCGLPIWGNREIVNKHNLLPTLRCRILLNNTKSSMVLSAPSNPFCFHVNSNCFLYENFWMMIATPNRLHFKRRSLMIFHWHSIGKIEHCELLSQLAWSCFQINLLFKHRTNFNEPFLSTSVSRLGQGQWALKWSMLVSF